MPRLLTPTQLAALTQGDWLKHRTDDLWFVITAISEPRDIGGGRMVRDVAAELIGRPNYTITELLMASATSGTVKADRVRFAADLRVAA
jgi:hypothetical protein